MTSESRGGDDARSVVLARVRAALGRDAAERTRVDAEWEALPRGFDAAPGSDHEELLHLMEERLRDYDAWVERVHRAGLRAAIDRRLELQGWPRTVVPAGMPHELLEGGVFVEDTGFSAQELDGFAAVMTRCTVGIALTGTLVLQGVPGQGRRAATLVPDYHLCLLQIADVVRSVPEAIAVLERGAGLPTTFISGPSATADIEMTRIKGVHGPRVLDVLLIDGKL